jgi:quaternary ammonium compound-resistance protein SugE
MKTGTVFNLDFWIQLLPLISYFVLGLLIAIVISRAYKLLTMSVVYASWMGLSLALQVIVDVNFFGERMQIIQYVCIFLVLAGILGMKLSNPKKIINPIIDDSLD